MNIFNKKDVNVKEYPVSDFYLAAYLKAKKFTLIDIEREGRRVTFKFEDKDIREQLVKEFYNNGSVEVNPFIHAIQDLKSIIYNIPYTTTDGKTDKEVI